MAVQIVMSPGKHWRNQWHPKFLRRQTTGTHRCGLLCSQLRPGEARDIWTALEGLGIEDRIDRELIIVPSAIGLRLPDPRAFAVAAPIHAMRTEFDCGILSCSALRPQYTAFTLVNINQ